MGPTRVCCSSVRSPMTSLIADRHLPPPSPPLQPITHAFTQPTIPDPRTFPLPIYNVVVSFPPPHTFPRPFSPSPSTRDAPALPRSTQYRAFCTRKRKRRPAFGLPPARPRYNNAHDRGRDTGGETSRARRAERAGHTGSDKRSNSRLQISIQRILFPDGY